MIYLSLYIYIYIYMYIYIYIYIVIYNIYIYIHTYINTDLRRRRAATEEPEPWLSTYILIYTCILLIYSNMIHQY